MFKWLSSSALARAYRDPAAWAALLVDLFPVYAVLYFGWDAAALVFLYWLENLIIGLITLLRMVASSLANGLRGGTAMILFGPFFIFHYGMFCFVHGIFLAVLAAIGRGAGEPEFMSPMRLVEFALAAGQHMAWFAGAILALQLFLFLRDFLWRGGWRETNIMDEMAKPYGRVIVLHFGLFVGFGGLIALGQPMAGILALILLRAAWSLYLSMTGKLQPQRESANKVDGASLV